jgi:tRNA (mo5U34)-methyltransferase
LLKNGGELVLETLVVDDAPDGVLVPKDRYAQMRNVWCLFTVEKLAQLLDDAGFNDISCVDVNTTSLEEQRTTDWMKFHSLKEFLDSNDLQKTIEGYPAPKRATFIATK